MAKAYNRFHQLAEAAFSHTYEQRRQHSELLVCFHTEFGPLNQIVQLWKFADVNERGRGRPVEHQMAQRLMPQHGLSWDEARQRQIGSIPARRLGKPQEFGRTCAFLCSAQASYMAGMYIRFDGGSYPALL